MLGLLISSNINVQTSAKILLSLILKNHDFMKKKKLNDNENQIRKIPNKISIENLDYSLSLGIMFGAIIWPEFLTPHDIAFDIIKGLLKGIKQIINYILNTGLTDIDTANNQSLSGLFIEFDHLFEEILRFVTEYVHKIKLYDSGQEMIIKAKQKQQEKIDFIVKRINDVCSILLKRGKGRHTLKGVFAVY